LFMGMPFLIPVNDMETGTTATNSTYVMDT
jgi:hypothetical protein